MIKSERQQGAFSERLGLGALDSFQVDNEIQRCKFLRHVIYAKDVTSCLLFAVKFVGMVGKARAANPPSTLL